MHVQCFLDLCTWHGYCNSSLSLAPAMVVLECGDVATWGRGQAGALGHGDETTITVPRFISSLQGIRISHAAAGWNHSAFVTGVSQSFLVSQPDFRLIFSHDVFVANSRHAHFRYPKGSLINASFWASMGSSGCLLRTLLIFSF